MSVEGIVLLMGVEGPSPLADTIPWAGGPELYKTESVMRMASRQHGCVHFPLLLTACVM